MRTTSRLSWQITLSFLVFGAVLTLTLGLGLVAALKSVETNMLDDTLRAELAHFRSEVETAREVGAFNSRTTVIFVTPLDELHTIPEQLRFQPGQHEFTRNNRDFRVLVEDVGDTRYTVRFEDTEVHRREREFVSLVWLTSLLALLIAFALGWLLSRRVSAPVSRLANQVTALRNDPNWEMDLTGYRQDEIGLLAAQFKHYHDQLRQLLSREKEFAGNVSHELRTPITNISLAAEVLGTKLDLTAKDRVRIQRIQRATDEMSELVDTFLVLARIDDSSAEKYIAADLRPLVDDVIEQQRVWLSSKPIEVTVQELAPTRVAAPASILSVMIANLVRNAFRYTRRGRIEIILTGNQICVSDTGVGIDAATQAHLFKRHVRGKSGDTDGAGLGLSIVQRICERHGWSVSVTSDEGQGSRFTVTFAVPTDGTSDQATV